LPWKGYYHLYPHFFLNQFFIKDEYFLSTVLNGRKRYAEGGLERALDLKQAGRAATQEEADWGAGEGLGRQARCPVSSGW
jgi:hypothetical protein